ncbi:MAG: hypothetical protein J5502_05210 [Prevotella sp.]|nr:hypothetical protein [Prevotella sp.]
MRSISPTSVRMLIDESRQADIVQGYAYHAKSFYQACQFVAERLLDTINMSFNLLAFKYEMIKAYSCWLEENGLENNEVNARDFSNVFRKEVSKRMFEKFKE